MEPPAPKNTIASPSSIHKLEAAIFHTMAFTLSLEFYNDKITFSTKRSFLKVFNNVCKVKKKPINFEEVSRIKKNCSENCHLRDHVFCGFHTEFSIYFEREPLESHNRRGL